ncbi:TadE/TadG family type IV pilus assembly protein [Sinorhizobium sp. RAC02]|uniref:TadE/TadG family type IV pilus assembly protein n=1 Tax=Sinorhizobium sp. RAC02 TaxID=1842534 RepID=UPI0008560685|nr:TadE/TadG family type IV pilus assembly protein [Sinorhizobium sp. RAC02]AOF92052.1 tadE-like family protein [Sinorhizobium sp. RAC02]
MRTVFSPVLVGKRVTLQGRSLLRRFGLDRQGAGAIEFAIVAPLLIMAYVSAFEISVGINMSSKVSRAASTVSDLLTQESATTADTLDTMKEVTKRVIAPFQQADGYTLKITGVAVDADGKATVAWSRDQAKGEPYTKGTAVVLPSNIQGAKSLFFVRTELSVPYTILLMAPNLSSRLSSFPLAKTSYFGLRKGKTIACSGC